MRIDKFLKVSHILKRRTVSKSACEGDRVFVNGKAVKPSYNLKIGDLVSVKFGNGELNFKVLALKEHVKKENASTLYEIVGE